MGKRKSATAKKHNTKSISIQERNKIIEDYLPLIHFIAKKISVRLPANIKIEDLISSGVIGLMDAIDKYDPGRDNKFKTYAEFRIRGSILDELRAQDWVPRSVRDKEKILDKAATTLAARLGRTPTDLEVSKHLGLTLSEFHTLSKQVCPVNVLSIDKPSVFNNIDCKSLLNILEKDGDPFAYLNVKSIQNVIKKFISELPERQRIVLSLYYYAGYNLRQIGSVLGVTESRISQLHAQAIKRLKMKLHKKFKKHELAAA